MNFGAIDLFMIFFITLGPLKSAIVYTTLTADAEAGFRRRVAIKTVATSTAVAVLFMVAGEFILKAFHMSIPALKIAGGPILLLFALEMVRGSASKESDDTGMSTSTDIGVLEKLPAVN